MGYVSFREGNGEMMCTRPETQQGLVLPEAHDGF